MEEASAALAAPRAAAAANEAEAVVEAEEAAREGGGGGGGRWPAATPSVDDVKWRRNSAKELVEGISSALFNDAMVLRGVRVLVLCLLIPGPSRISYCSHFR